MQVPRSNPIPDIKYLHSAVRRERPLSRDPARTWRPGLGEPQHRVISHNSCGDRCSCSCARPSEQVRSAPITCVDVRSGSRGVANSPGCLRPLPSSDPYRACHSSCRPASVCAWEHAAVYGPPADRPAVAGHGRAPRTG